MEIIIKSDSEELSREFAVWITGYIEKKLAQQEIFTLVLSGGSTPKKLYQLLASEKFKNRIDWKKIHFFWGDERYVPLNDDKNNAKMAFDTLLDHVPVMKENIHIMRTDIAPKDSSLEYEKILHNYFPGKNKTFDLVLLGLGDNAHTLSLFPEKDVVNEKEKWVSFFYLKEQEMHRITLTAPVVNAAGCVVFLVAGADKAASVKHVIDDEHNPDLYPAQVIQPFNGELYWWLDEAAAADLE